MKYLGFILLAIIFIGCQTQKPAPNNPDPDPIPKDETVNVRFNVFGADVPYTVVLSSREKSGKRWSETRENIQGNTTFTQVPLPNSDIAGFYYIESSGMYDVDGFWLEEASLTNKTYSLKVPLIKMLKVSSWDVTDDNDPFGRHADATFKIAPMDQQVTFDIDGRCEVYGDDYYFEDTITLGKGETSFGITSLNGNKYNNTQFSCYFSSKPIRLGSTTITNIDGASIFN
jgi:hypothetical protein